METQKSSRKRGPVDCAMMAVAPTRDIETQIKTYQTYTHASCSPTGKCGEAAETVILVAVLM